jgi:hypothetical protein
VSPESRPHRSLGISQQGRTKQIIDGVDLSVGDRVEGKKDSIVGAVMGDKAQQMSGNMQHDKGATQMDINKRECYPRLSSLVLKHGSCCSVQLKGLIKGLSEENSVQWD